MSSTAATGKFEQRPASTRRGKKALEKRAPKELELRKKILFLKGTKSSDLVNKTLHEIFMLVRTHAMQFKRGNAIYPFEDPMSLEFYSFKNGTPLIVFGSHMKKRPNRITVGRLFNHSMLDLVEFQVLNLTQPNLRDAALFGSGCRHMMCFHGSLWSRFAPLDRVKNLLLDLFGGWNCDRIAADGLDSILVATIVATKHLDDSAVSAAVTGDDLSPFKIVLSHYALAASGRDAPTGLAAADRSSVPAPEIPESATAPLPGVPSIALSASGMRLELTVQRCALASQKTFQKTVISASKKAKALAAARTGPSDKAVTRDVMGRVTGQLHVGVQDTRKGLVSRKYDATRALRAAAGEKRAIDAAAAREEGGDGDVNLEEGIEDRPTKRAKRGESARQVEQQPGASKKKRGKAAPVLGVSAEHAM